MTKDSENPNRPGKQIDVHMQDGFKLDAKPPLSPDERRRRVILLCCGFMRNLAFHRAGMDIEVRRKLLDPRHPQAAFWREVHGNFFDICVLDWCKLFADRKGKHHWRCVVENPNRFEADLCATLGVTADEFENRVKAIRHYRDKFEAHLDQEREMLLPTLEMARKATVFIHERLVQQAGGCGDRLGLPTLLEGLEQGFAQASREAQSVYADALARLAMER